VTVTYDSETDVAVAVPRLNSVDDGYILVEWLVADGEPVAAGEALVVLETSKATADVEAPAAGLVSHRLRVGAECRIGQTMAVIQHGARSAPSLGTPPDAGADGADPPELWVTEKARRLADRHGVTDAELRAGGRSMVREGDVLAILAERNAGDTTGAVPLSPGQAAVKTVVEKSHREIPSAYAGLTVRADAAIRFAEKHSRETRTLIGITELVVRAVARQHETFPRFFGRLTDDGSALMPAPADVGITMDLGQGLYVPVVRDVGALPLADLARTAMRLRRKAIAGEFLAEDLDRPGIVVALNNTGPISVAVPIVFPGTVACVSVCSIQNGLELDPAGQLRAVQTFHLGLAYDHRVINGREAGLFLHALQHAIEQEPERNVGP
jgi:2-oxoglutarate dehydrogenase E2 component (dihydrolipoamide succinyltransferase)